MSGGGDEAEVDALLRAAQDAVLLKLQANSHLVSSSSTPRSLDPEPDSLDDDLARRFNALKSRPPAPPKRPDAATAAGAGGMGDMEARFAALKGAAVPEKEARVRLEDLGGESEDDEVEKVMRWAMDAARLDVATSGSGGANATQEDEEDKSSLSSKEDDEDEGLELEMEKKRNEKMSKSKSKNKWFFF